MTSCKYLIFSSDFCLCNCRDSFFSSLDEDEKKDERFDISAIATDSDRQLHFADFVIELQAAEDDKRRRIRDARRRAEKAQREAYREVLQKLAAARKITPSTQWRSIEELVFMDESFNLVAAQDRNSPRSLFEEFVGEWDDIYHRERSFLSRLLHQPNKKEIQVKAATPYEEFTKLLLDEASHSQELYGDTRQIINTGEPISSARLYYDELIARAADLSKRGSARRRPGEESSEDEGEIIEDGELEESDDAANKPSE
jgi:pre-mRNA-processing factor 40